MAPERYGSYMVYEQLGKGGMATVHRAELETPEGIKQVALKRLVPTMEKKPVQLFLDEARLLRYLHHPNIPETYDSGRVFGTYFIAMEYVPGPTIKELIAHCSVTVGPVPQAGVLNMAAQLCDALDYAHKRRDERGRPLGIIHRDVTPANLILTPSGLLKLVDFGLAKASLTEDSAAGIIKGKHGYIAPEYINGKLDPRADLWAVGIIMYELLTGRRLFDGPNAFQTISRIRELPIPRPSIANPKVTPDVDDVVMTALMRDPRRRWPSAAALRDRIHQVAAQHQPMDNQKVSEWVTWALAQKRGTRAPQVTPVVPMPVRMTDTTEPMEKPPDMISLAPSTRSVVWTVCACLLGLLALVGLVWKLVR